MNVNICFLIYGIFQFLFQKINISLLFPCFILQIELKTITMNIHKPIDQYKRIIYQRTRLLQCEFLIYCQLISLNKLQYKHNLQVFSFILKFIDKRLSSHSEMSDDQGWQTPKHEYQIHSQTVIPSKWKLNFKKEGAYVNSILKDKNHSLEPDMLFGWKPKLPSCPLPLAYPNAYNQLLMNHIPNDDRFKIVYIGQRYVNSVQVNQQYGYFWKYRERYSLNLALVQEAVNNVGKQNFEIVKEILESNKKNNLKGQKQVSFDSSFQSGNLQLAVKVKKNQYDLFIRSDSNTKGHTNWYYFRVDNHDFVGNIQFNVCNMAKTKNLYNKGMRPYILENQFGEWAQEQAFDVNFVQRYCRYGFDKKTYQLQFKYNFREKNSSVYFAYAIPYTYSKLQNFIQEISNSHPYKVTCKKLCQSLGGLNVPLLTITNNNKNEYDNEQNQDINTTTNRPTSITKKAVLITGRIHPGQSNASHVLEGFIRQLLKNEKQYQMLRDRYIFYVIPMLNPDGVVIGNFRTSYSGKDLNRQFTKLNKYLFPQITYMNELTNQLKQTYKKGVEFYFDFHGHSSKKNLFCYGPQHPTTKLLFFKCRTLAKLIEQASPIFSYRKSLFTVNQHKKTTGRAHMLWKMKIPMTYTFEVSNGMYQTKQNKCILFDQRLLQEAGIAIMKGMTRYIQMELKIPISMAKAKVDSGIRKTQTVSQKSVRSKSALKFRKFSKQLQKDNKNIMGISQKDISLNDNKEFLKFVKQIKKEPINNGEQEGGSDSQGDQDDLSAEQTQKLAQFIKNKNKECKSYSKSVYNYKLKAFKPEFKKKISEDSKDKEKQSKQNENYRIKVRTNKSMTSGRRSHQFSNKIPLPPKKLPPTIQYEKIVLAQKNFTMDI